MTVKSSKAVLARPSIKNGRREVGPFFSIKQTKKLKDRNSLNFVFEGLCYNKF